jgi:hypothetical protein
MRQPFGSSLNLTFLPARAWFSLGPGWAMLAGVLSGHTLEFSFTGVLQLLALWVLVDPLLGSLWELSVEQGVWRALGQAQLPPPLRHGFYLPYAQPNSVAGQGVLWVRRFGRWWRQHYWPERGEQCLTFLWGSALALVISFSLNFTLFQLTLLALGLTLLAGQMPSDLTAADGGRLQSVAQLLLPWVMGIVLWSTLTPFSLVVVICYWVTYLGGLRMLGYHHRAEWLYWMGQVTAIMLLLALRQLPGAALLGVLLVTQRLVYLKFSSPPDFLARVQPYLIFSVLSAGWSLGHWFNV